jgi:serine/threonine-protein kinase
LPLGTVMRIVADAARGLEHAHLATDDAGEPLGVVHRDVTPHNLFVCRDGVTKVLDFGIAKATSQLHQTRVGTLKGKFSYLAPEQIHRDAWMPSLPSLLSMPPGPSRPSPSIIDRRVDVFALGIVLHELLTMRPLFRGANDAETLDNVLSREIVAPERVRSDVPPALGALALRALQRDRERRLPSAAAIADSLEAVAEAEGIDTSRERVAELLAELFPEPSTEPPVTMAETRGWPSYPLGAHRGAATPPPGIEIADLPTQRSNRLRLALWVVGLLVVLAGLLTIAALAKL